MQAPNVPLSWIASACLGWCAAGVAQEPESEPARPPNFVLIYCDDLGYADIGCFGSKKHRTPHIDRIAKEGVRLTSFYVTSGVCTPSRASLMTGCYPRRVGMHQDARGQWVLFPIAKKGLHPDEVTVAEVLKARGYKTACVGKWHLGDQRDFLPTRQGFDSYFGIPYSNDMGRRKRGKRPPLPLMRDEKVIEAPVDQAPLTRRYTEEAIRFLEQSKDEPFFLYLPHTFPHVPLFASEEFRGKSNNGKFGDAVEEIDWSTGRILDALERLGLEENTVVWFTSDNGAARRHGGSNAPLRGFKGSTWEGGMRVACVVRWPGVIEAGSTSDELMTTLDILPTFAAIAGAQPPEGRKIDGLDARAVLGGGRSPRKAFYYYFRDQLQAVRSGRFKLHVPRTQRRRELPARLFDLKADIGESENVAAEHPAVVKRLMELAQAARAELGDRGRRGRGQRSAGIRAEPVPLTRGGR